MEQKSQQVQKSLKIIKWINAVTAGVIVAFGLAGSVYTAITNLIAAKFFMIFSPIYMILFGIILFATEFKVDFVLQKVGFLRSLLGRAVFNIFLASQVFYFFSCGTGNELLGVVFGIVLFALGIFYGALHFCKGNQYSQQIKSRLQH